MRIRGPWPLLLLVALLPALITGAEFLYRLAFVLMASSALGALWVWVNLRGLEIERDLRSPRAQVGGKVEDRLFLRNRSRLPKFWLEIMDESDLAGHRASRIISYLGPGQELSWGVESVPRRRGQYRLGPVLLTSRDPLGFFEARRRFPAVAPLVVYPATLELAPLALPRGPFLGGATLRRRTQEITPNASGVREYHPGDSLNRIHWPSVARTGRLLSKEFEQDPLADVWIVLDFEEASHVVAPREDSPADEPAPTDPGWMRRQIIPLPPSTEEYAVTLAASLARQQVGLGRGVGLIAWGARREVLPVDRGERPLAKILETLAVIRADGETPLAEVLSAEASRFVGTTTLVITSSTAEAWVGALRHLGGRAACIVIYIEPGTFGSAPSSLRILGALAAANLPTYLVKCGDQLAPALSQPLIEPVAQAAVGEK